MLVVAITVIALPTWAAPKPNAYERLGISTDASEEDVAAAFRRAWGDAGLLRALIEPSRWRSRWTAVAAYRRVGNAMSRDRYDEKLDRAEEVAATLSAPEDAMLRQLRARHMPDFVTPAQIEALSLATRAFGPRAVAWHLEKLAGFTSEHQVRALAIAILATGAEAKDSLDSIAQFRSAPAVEALEILATVLGPRLRFKYGTVLPLQSSLQIEALGVLARTLGRNVEHHLHYVARINHPNQVEALRIVAAAIGPAIEYDLGKMIAFSGDVPLRALAIAAPILKSNLTFHLPTLAKFTQPAQVEALAVAAERIDIGIQDIIYDIQSITSPEDAALVAQLPERDGTRFKDELRRIARTCRTALTTVRQHPPPLDEGHRD